MKKLLALIAMVAMVAVSSVAFAQNSSVTVGTNVGNATSIETLCWHQDEGFNMAWYGTMVSLIQPGDKGEDAEDGDPADGQDTDWGTITGTEQYDTLGGNPLGSLTGEAGNAFGYGDCKTTVSTSDHSWDIALTAGDFKNAGHTVDIDDMGGFETTGFDMLLDNGATGYHADEEEHGFYILGDSTGIGALINQDNGTAGGVSYGTPKNFDALTCGSGSEPCYHGLENSLGQQLYSDTSAGLNSQEFITRFGVGVDDNTDADSYSMTATYTITI